ncbi:MAG TPA: hypothetical protein VGC99_22495, partial [Candidatus Tectomicrobia bacterium]
VDSIQHKAHWTKASAEELRAGIEAAIGGRVDVIVWLDLPLALKLGRLCRRSWRRVRTREVLWNGNFETWRDVFMGRDSVLVHATRAHFRHRRTIPSRPDAHNIVRLRTPIEVDRWLSSMFPPTGELGSTPGDFAANQGGAG